MGQTITLTASDGNAFSAYRADPEGSPKGGVVVVQEIFGVNNHIRSVADRYASLGYVAVAPALFDRVEGGVELGYDTEGIERGRVLAFDGVTMDQVMADVEAAADEAAAGGKVGIVGYCWGGTICFVAAGRLSEKIAAASGYYGGQILQYPDDSPVSPVLLHFGSEDKGIPMDTVEKIRVGYPQVDIHIYEGADHGFNCDARPSYSTEAATIAQDRTIALFSEHLS